MRKRLGEILLEKGYLNVEQIEQALEIQMKISKKGMWRYIGQILIENGVVTPSQVNEGLEALERLSK